MKFPYYVLLALFIFSLCVRTNAQYSKDTIICYKGIVHIYEQNGKKIHCSDVFKLLKQYPEAVRYKNNSISKKVLGTFCFAIGGVIIGSVLIESKSDENNQNGNLYSVNYDERNSHFFLGVVSIVGAFYLFNRQDKDMKKAISIYNQEIIKKNVHQTSLNLGLTNNGVGFRLSF